MLASNVPFAPRCNLCGSQNHLIRCDACKVVEYCNRDHQADDRTNHEIVCSKVKEAQAKLDVEEQKLNNNPFLPAKPFETCISHFHFYWETVHYRMAREFLVEALLEIKTFAATQSAYDHARDLIRLDPSDEINIHEVMFPLLLRLGRDQELYNIVKWFNNRNFDDDGNIKPPFLDVIDADVFESFDFEWTQPQILVTVILLKIRLVLDLRNLQNFPTQKLLEKFPQEIVDEIKAFVPLSPVISQSKEIMQEEDHSARIKMLETQIYDHSARVKMLETQIYELGDAVDPYFCRKLLMMDPRTDTYDAEETEPVIQLYFDAWNETPGAIAFMKEVWSRMSEKHTGL